MNDHPVLKKLLTGNMRYVEDRSRYPNQSPSSRKKFAQGQSPPAAVLACADSRVAPEFLLDQGLGDLFVIRAVGNTPNPRIFGNPEYTVEHPGTQLTVVLSHKRHGAVGADRFRQSPAGPFTQPGPDDCWSG